MTDKIVPIALKMWLAFLIALVLVGYSVPTSIVLGAIGGFSGGMVMAWWDAKGGEPTAPPLPEQMSKVGQQIRQTGSRLPFKQFFSRRGGR